MTQDDEQDSGLSASSDGPTSRRGLIAGAAVGGAAVVGALAGAGTTAALANGRGWRRVDHQLDVACLGHTWRDALTRNPADDGDFRGAFSVEGLIYPPGTVTDGFVPTATGSIGHWFCQGWVVIDASRPEPHVASTQQYMLEQITESRLFPGHSLASSGLEGTSDDGQPPLRIVTGGSGDYLGATGQVLQENRGHNTTVLDDGSGESARNFAFTFDLLLPEL